MTQKAKQAGSQMNCSQLTGQWTEQRPRCLPGLLPSTVTLGANRI